MSRAFLFIVIVSLFFQCQSSTNSEEASISLAALQAMVATQEPSRTDTDKILSATITNGDYINHCTQLLAHQEQLLQDYPSSVYYQELATTLSYLGLSDAAHEAWQIQADTIVCELADSSWQQINELNVLAAKEYILTQAQQEQIVLINEAHHIADHRRFTASLLEGLYQNGFRYLAVETITHGRAAALNERKYPFQNNGTYLVEPQYGELVRNALELGFELLAYDASYGDNYSNRDSVQALNILAVLEKNPNAKILVHAGYGHIYEGSNSHWTKMGQYIHRLSGINPFSIDQVKLSARHPLNENCYYRAIEQSYALKKSAVLLHKNKAWITPSIRSFVDLQLIHPRPTRRSGRAIAAFTDGKQKLKYVPPLKKTNLLIQCFKKEEYLAEENYTNLIPVDQYIKTAQQANVTLLLRPGHYVLRICDLNYKELAVEDLLVEE